MKSFRLLVALPLFFGALLFVTASIAPASTALRVEIEMVKTLDLVGCLLAAFAFGKGDYLRRAWAIAATCAALLLLRDGVLRLGPLEGASVARTDLVDGCIVLAANVAAVAGLWMMARAWSVAGLEPPGSARGRRALVGVGVVSAIAVGATAIFFDARTVVRGDLAGLVPVASDLGDVVSILLIAPVASTALAMRGGTLRWPWGLLTTSITCWLLYDVATLLRTVGSIAPKATIAAEVARALACTYTFSAGVAQRWVVRRG